VIALLPNCLPVGPGQSCDHMSPLGLDDLIGDAFPAADCWRRAHAYSRDHCGNFSVTLGGPLFDLASLALDENVPNPFEDFSIVEALAVRPTPRGPDSPMFTEVQALLDDWASQVWVTLGGRENAPLEALPPVPQMNPQIIRDIVEPLVNKNKEFRLFP
jgi:hypothetical protein